VKTLTLSRKRIEAAVTRGHGYAAQWRERFESEPDWQWACIELASLPEVWKRMGRKQAEDDPGCDEAAHRVEDEQQQEGARRQ
jgi:hypothetical protein